MSAVSKTDERLPKKSSARISRASRQSLFASFIAQRPSIQDYYSNIQCRKFQESDTLSYIPSKSHLKIRKDQRVDSKPMVCNALQNTNYKSHILNAQYNAV